MKTITFKQAVDDYLNYVELKTKNSTYNAIKNRMETHIIPEFENCDIRISPNDYLNWQLKIDKKGLKYNYKSSLHTTFVGFLNYCMNFYDLKENVASRVGNFKNNEIESVGSVWTIEEFNKFISSVDDPIYKTLFEFLYFTGCREGEALALTFNDIDSDIVSINKTMTRFFENGKRIITKPKTKKSIRNIRIDSQLKTSITNLQTHYSTHFEDFNKNFYIFGGRDMIPPSTLARKKNYYCDVAHVKRIKIHEFRHSHACLLFQNDVPIDEISNRLGHSTIGMTMNVYLKYIPKNEKRVLATLNSLRLSP